MSNKKFHVRGPVGLEGLMTCKWILKGNGHIAASYIGDNAAPFTHRLLDKRCSLVEPHMSRAGESGCKNKK